MAGKLGPGAGPADSAASVTTHTWCTPEGQACAITGLILRARADERVARKHIRSEGGGPNRSRSGSGRRQLPESPPTPVDLWPRLSFVPRHMLGAAV